MKKVFLLAGVGIGFVLGSPRGAARMTTSSRRSDRSPDARRSRIRSSR